LTIAIQDRGSGLAAVAQSGVTGATVKLPKLRVSSPREHLITVKQKTRGRSFSAAFEISDFGGSVAECLRSTSVVERVEVERRAGRLVFNGLPPRKT
jgi:hypothetical protein